MGVKVYNRYWRMLLVAVVLFGLAASGFGAGGIRLAQVFGDGMVLQRDMAVPVWGWSEPGAEVEVRFGSQRVKCQAGDDGRWLVKLAPLGVSTSGVPLLAVSAGITNRIKDVLVGDVWLCTGQSNMDFPAVNFMGPASDPAAGAIKKLVAGLHDPLLRQYAAPYCFSPGRRRDKADFSCRRNKRWPAVGHWIKAIKFSDTSRFTGTGLCFAIELRKALPEVPIGLLKCAWGGTPVEAWIPPYCFGDDADLKEDRERYMKVFNRQMSDWNAGVYKRRYQEALAHWEQNGRKGNKPHMANDPRNPVFPNYPGTLFNGMLAPMIPYAVRGVIWYQGESNRRRAPQSYAHRLATMISAWRKAWGLSQMPFYIVQLANFKNQSAECQKGWTVVMDQQRRVLDMLPHTGLAVTIDIGNATNIHPRNKIDVGKRLAQWALKNDYARDVSECSGPLYKGCKIEKNKVVVEFTHVGAGLMAGRKQGIAPVVATQDLLKRFEVCGAAGKWVPAAAKIVGDRLEVSAPDVPEPVAVRYAWAANPAGANLYNKAGLPASPFTSE